MTVTPSGCRWCGIPKRGHAQQWTAAGGHTWEQPTGEQILSRMLERRAVRATARAKPANDSWSARFFRNAVPGEE